MFATASAKLVPSSIIPTAIQRPPAAVITGVLEIASSKRPAIDVVIEIGVVNKAGMPNFEMEIMCRTTAFEGLSIHQLLPMMFMSPDSRNPSHI